MCYGHFEHYNEDALAIVIKRAIRGTPDFSFRTISTIANAMVTLDIKNMALFESIK